MATPFSSFSLEEVAVLLRQVYSPEEGTGDSLAAVPDVILLRLAHLLQADSLLEKVGHHAAQLLQSVLGITNAAGACQLADLSQLGLDNLTSCFGSVPTKLAADDAMVIASQLGRQPLAALLQALASPAPLEITLEVPNFSASTGVVRSPVYCMAEAAWRLKLYPKGNNTQDLSLYRECLSTESMPIKVDFTLAVHSALASETVRVP